MQAMVAPALPGAAPISANSATSALSIAPCSMQLSLSGQFASTLAVSITQTNISDNITISTLKPLKNLPFMNPN
jgi:hypothetical protein